MSEDTNGQDGRTRAPSVDAKTFIRAYNSSTSIDEVVEKTGLSRHTVLQRASTYRTKYNIRMRKFPQQLPPRNDWEALAAFADEVLDEVGYEETSSEESESDENDNTDE